MKLLFSPDGKKLFGAQIVGRGGVDKRIDTIGVAMRLGGGRTGAQGPGAGLRAPLFLGQGSRQHGGLHGG
jgi:hypothetical protein